MKKFNKWLLGSGFLALLVFLSGCVKTDANNQPTGFVYNYLGHPMSLAIRYLVDNFNWSYGLAIIAITIIVRIIILPLGLSQSKKSFIQTEKMQAIKPQVDAVQAKIKEATTREEQMQANAELQQVYKDNNVNLLGGMGCLPLLIQMPIFSALFSAIRYTPGINESTFLGINLGAPNYMLVALAGLAYVLQGYLSMIGISEEQKKTMKSMLVVSPLMIVMMSWASPAGVTLYWIIGGIFTCVQTLITNVFMRPKIKAQLAEEMKNNPKTVVVPRKDVTPTATVTEKPQKNKTARNAGKQNRK